MGSSSSFAIECVPRDLYQVTTAALPGIKLYHDTMDSSLRYGDMKVYNINEVAGTHF